MEKGTQNIEGTQNEDEVIGVQVALLAAQKKAAVSDYAEAKKILEEQSKDLPAKKIDTWRNEISRMFLNNEIKTPQEIIDKLKSFLFEVHQPVQRSSITIGESLGFSLSDLLK